MGEQSDSQDTGPTGRPRLKYFPAVKTHLLTSKIVNQVFQVQVMRPPELNTDQNRFPVVYATDGNASFDMFKGMSWVIQAAGLVRPFILVGIGYPSHSPIAGERLRGRDLTFSGCPDYFSGLAELEDWSDILTPAPGTPHIGGAVAFQSFLTEELIAFVDGNYPTIAGDCTYVGHSMAGGFGLNTFISGASPFGRYVISSPTLWYEGKTPSGVSYSNHDLLIAPVKEFLSRTRPHHDVRLYLSVGSAEEDEPLLSNWRLVSGYHRLVEVLASANPTWLNWTAEVLQGESHATSWPIAFMHGVQAVLGK